MPGSRKLYEMCTLHSATVDSLIASVMPDLCRLNLCSRCRCTFPLGICPGNLEVEKGLLNIELL